MARGKIGAFLGILAGATLGVLFAPKKGKHLREKIKKELDTGGSGMDSIKEAFQGMGEDIAGSCGDCYSGSCGDLVEKGKAKAKQVVHKTADKAKKHLAKVEKKVTNKLKPKKK